MAIVEVWSKKPADAWPDQRPGAAHCEVDRHHQTLHLTKREMDAFAHLIVDTVVRHPDIIRRNR